MIKTVVQADYGRSFRDYCQTKSPQPLLLCGDALHVLREFPAESVDCCMTSPPYWGQRLYTSTGIGLEGNFREYVRNLAAICAELKRVLK